MYPAVGEDYQTVTVQCTDINSTNYLELPEVFSVVKSQLMD